MLFETLDKYNPVNSDLTVGRAVELAYHRQGWSNSYIGRRRLTGAVVRLAHLTVTRLVVGRVRVRGRNVHSA